VTTPALVRSRTAKDSRIVWRCCGGIEERGSEDVVGLILSFIAGEEVGVRL
jgi:hypothetical protein